MIQIENMSFRFDKDDLFQNINVTIDRGDFVAFVGDNGTGKSTLIKLLLKSQSGYTGQIRLFGEDLRKFSDYRRVGYVSQKSNAFNAKFPATVGEIVTALTRHRSDLSKVLEQVGLPGFEKRLIGQLSGGQQQRVFIARALIDRPELLLLDEPTVGIDQQSVQEIVALLGRLNRQGITILMTTHNYPTVQDYINKILWLKGDGSTKLFDAHHLSEDDLCDIYGHPLPMHHHAHHGS